MCMQAWTDRGPADRPVLAHKRKSRHHAVMWRGQRQKAAEANEVIGRGEGKKSARCGARLIPSLSDRRTRNSRAPLKPQRQICSPSIRAVHRTITRMTMS